MIKLTSQIKRKFSFEKKLVKLYPHIYGAHNKLVNDIINFIITYDSKQIKKTRM